MSQLLTWTPRRVPAPRAQRSSLKSGLLLLFFLLPIVGVCQCWLEARGTQIVNSSTGQEVILRGVNLGNWGLQEGYMLNPGNPNLVGTQWAMKKLYYNQGQTEAQVEAFYSTWRNNFITKADIDYIASLGFNTIRLPMHYELFLTPSQRSVRNSVIRDINNHDTYKSSLQTWYNNNQLFNDTGVDGFRMIDNLVSWCKANNMYVVLDLHAAPGGQGTDKNIADIFWDNNLWQFPVFQDVTTRLWERLAQRYRSEPAIAMYDILNEPNNVPGGGPTIRSLLQRLISAIRNQGDNHLLLLNGNGWGNNYDYLEPYNFSPNWGLVYNAHRYGIAPADDWVRDANPNQINRIINMIEFRTRHNVPVWVGETGENSASWMSQNINTMNSQRVGWCHWTYKRHDVYENAALMRIGGNYPTDGASAMNTVLEQIKFANNIRNTNTIAAVTSSLPAPRTSGCSFNQAPTVPVAGQVIWLRGNNGQYVSSENGVNPIICNRPTVGGWERFTVVSAGNGAFALRGSNNAYVSSENGTRTMQCNRTTIGGWEQFTFISNSNGTISLRASNGAFVSSMNGQSAMMCDRTSIQGWEQFSWGTSTTGASIDGVVVLEENSDYQVFPNPSYGQVFIRVSEPTEVKIFDTFTGRTVLHSEFRQTTQVPNLSPGIYGIRFGGQGKSKTKKIIVR
jgi:endoglucanase